MTPEQIKNKIVEVLDSKKGKDILDIFVGDKTTIADYFVLVTGTSTPHINALCDYVEEELEKDDVRIRYREGARGSKWIVLDYNCVVVHIFAESEREHFNLEELWSGDSIPKLDMPQE